MDDLPAPHVHLFSPCPTAVTDSIAGLFKPSICCFTALARFCDNVLFVFVPPNGSVYPSIVILQFVYLASDKPFINVFRAVFAASTSSYDPTLNSEPAGNDAFSTVVVVWVEIRSTIVFVSIVWHVYV